MTPVELGRIAKLARERLREKERDDRVTYYALREILARFEAEARAQRFGEPSMPCTVSYLDDWRSHDARARSAWRPCSECGRSTDRPRRGLCDRCRKREDRARAG